MMKGAVERMGMGCDNIAQSFPFKGGQQSFISIFLLFSGAVAKCIETQGTTSCVGCFQPLWLAVF
jgi:hypothetical protein